MEPIIINGPKFVKANFRILAFVFVSAYSI